MTTIGSTPPLPANSSLPPISPVEPSNSIKRSHPETSDSERGPPSKRAKTDERAVLDENCGDFYLLPDLVAYQILSYCKASALVRVGVTCKRLFYIADRTPMWGELCSRAKLSVKEGDSYRWVFLSAMIEGNPKAYRSKAHFFATERYGRVDYVRALACLDRAINMEPFLTKDRAFSEPQIEAVFQKAEIFFHPFNFNRSAFAPGQINALYDQLRHIFHTCSSKNKTAKACVLHTVVQINDLGLAALSYSSIWNALNSIRQEQQASDEVRNAAEYLLAFLCQWKPDARWDPVDLAQFRQNRGNLPEAERSRILKKCLTDQAATRWMHQMAKMDLAMQRLYKKTEEITDKEAYEMLESLKNTPNRIPVILPDTLESVMQRFGDEKRI